MNNFFNHHHRPTQRYGGLAIAALLVLPALPATAQYQITDLGVDVAPHSISLDGSVAGAHGVGTTRAFLYTWATGIQDLSAGIVANAVNAAGQTVGNTAGGAFLYTRGGGMQQWSGRSANAVNQSGIIAGSQAMPNPYGGTAKPYAPALYQNGGWRVLDVARVYSRGRRKGVYADVFSLLDVNELGYAVGTHRRTGLSGSSAFMTEPSFRKVIDLQIPGGGSGTAINNLNHVVGTSGASHAYLYDGANVIDLGTLKGGLRSSAADINDSDIVVGSAWLSKTLSSLYQPDQYHAFIWQKGSMNDLNDLIPANTGWTLTAATAISPTGRIVGTGLLGGKVHGFLLTPVP